MTYMKNSYALSIKMTITLSNDLLKKDKMSVFTIETSIKLFKVKKNLSNTIITDIFPTRVLNYNLTPYKHIFSSNNVDTTKIF